MEDLRKKILARQRNEDNEIFKEATVSILGCGGLGSNIAMMLARSGIGHINLYDFDVVEYSNLNRQNYSVNEVGQRKVDATKNRLEETLPFVDVKAYNIYLDDENLDQILDGANYFIEAFDNKESKIRVFDYFVNREGKYLFTASGLSGLGSLEDVKIKNFDNITMVGDFYSKPEEDGLYLPYVSIVASLEALECLKKIREDYYGR
ncbi:sulfur carrier protein ThiS adenylyltransferase ThiF [Anaerococcus sp. AGMB09787]|uniref:sulfur carrier protein ThiS adenylyltransferase ThiF n=1 Tax=Anaerococcus sp. AGMB09787 TaxID=2922869 RepID=UPI001FAED0D6|nr:sulfur carrier protein ThiS adenylyltransferase ThiF [Anaerococcus sp. AGMB09787]